MSIADIFLTIIIFIFQKMMLPLLPVNLPLYSIGAFSATLNGTLIHNIIYSFAGLDQFFNLKLLFLLLSSIIVGEILFWLVKAGFFVVKLVRG